MIEVLKENVYQVSDFFQRLNQERKEKSDQLAAEWSIVIENSSLAILDYDEFLRRMNFGIDKINIKKDVLVWLIDNMEGAWHYEIVAFEVFFCFDLDSDMLKFKLMYP